MLEVEYSSDFVRKYKKLRPALQAEVRARIEEFRDTKNHMKLNIHKLRGDMKGLSAFSINYRNRVVFQWSKDRKTAQLFDVGDHGVYE